MSQTERIFFIDRTVREHGGISIQQVCSKFEVSSRQAKRDIEYMRDRLFAPLVWSREKMKYYYSEEWNGLRFADESSFFAFGFLQAILNRYIYVPIVSEEITKLLKERIAGKYASISDKVRYELPDIETINGETAYLLCEALLDKIALQISYIDAKGGRSQRIIVPLRLINYAGKWYCIASDSKSMEMRVFLISRIEKIENTQYSNLQIPAEEDVERFISSSYGIFKGESVGIARLRFHGGAARAIRTQQWHKDQIITPIEDNNDPDAIELSVPVHDWTEILGRALRCGAHCEVISPDGFRARWIEEIERMNLLINKK